MDNLVEVVVEPMEPADLDKFKKGAIASGLRETTCSVCGCWMLTRGNDDRCPPHRTNSNQP